MKILRIKFGFGILLSFAIITSCEDLLEQRPPDDSGLIPPETAVESAEDLNELLISAYDVLANTYDGGAQNLPSLLSDDLDRPNNQQDFTEIWLRQSTIFNGTVSGVFANWYIAILRANTVLLRMDDVTGLTPVNRQRVEAEARFIRALCHFDVVRSFAQPYGYTTDNNHPGIAIRTTTDVTNIGRSTVAEVYDFILADLAFATTNLPESNSVFATRTSALALEAAVRFQMQEYDLAYSLSTEVINSGIYSLDTLVNRYQFPDVSPEAIFYIISYERGPGDVDQRFEPLRDSYLSEGRDPPMRISQDFFTGVQQFGGPRANLYEERDQDGNLFYVTSLFNAEFFNIPIFSLTQMMLIRAESSGELNQNLGQAIDDINLIRTRAYGSNINNLLQTANAQQVIDAARREMRYELPFTGQRIHDLRRRGAQGENITIRGASWDCPGMLIQFPATEQSEIFPLNPGGGC
jgi:hypothetical protein